MEIKCDKKYELLFIDLFPYLLIFIDLFRYLLDEEKCTLYVLQ